MSTPTPKTRIRDVLNATGKTGPRPRTGIEDATPLAARSVSNYELRKLGHWREPTDEEQEKADRIGRQMNRDHQYYSDS